MAELWGKPEAQGKAEAAIPGYLLQVYTTAMTAFIHNPTWEHVYATLAIGIYISQFHWERPSKGKLRAPIRYNTTKSIPHARQSELEIADALKEVDAAITECENRAMPDVLCWNAPMVAFEGTDNIDSDKPRIVLTPQLLWSMREPLKHFEGVRFQRSWLSAPTKRPYALTRKSIVRFNPLFALL